MIVDAPGSRGAPGWRDDKAMSLGLILLTSVGYKTGRSTMKNKLAITCVVLGALFGSVMAQAGQDSDADRSHPKAFVKDSAITMKIKAKLAAEHITSLGRIHVDTDRDGVVWLTGSARTQEAVDKAEAIARATEGVKAVHSHIKVRKDD
jgi:hyperosmotically inducible protein